MSVRYRDRVAVMEFRELNKRRWARPQLRRLDAGSAEQTSNSVTDVGVTFS